MRCSIKGYKGILVVCDRIGSICGTKINLLHFIHKSILRWVKFVATKMVLGKDFRASIVHRR